MLVSYEIVVFCMNMNLFAKVDQNGVFKSAFVVHYAAVDVVNAHGRPVCSTDFGHFKHDYFDGLNATGSCCYVFVMIMYVFCSLVFVFLFAQACSRWVVGSCWRSGLLFS
jgi:hypothetical protein